MELPGYDAWKLRGPDDDHPECGCGEVNDLRVLDGETICHGCYLEEVDAFKTLPTPSEYARDVADERADARYQRMRDEGER